LEQNQEDLRPEIVNFLRASAKGDWAQINSVGENLQQPRDKNLILDFINLAMLWLTDAYRYNINQDLSRMFNADMQEIISKFSGHYEGINYELLFEKMEQAYKDIKGNMNSGIVLFNLAIDLNKILDLRKSA